ncbi:MAG: MotA/TolQ/ExbB proton channel family protein [Planctomycetota bacterium]
MNSISLLAMGLMLGQAAPKPATDEVNLRVHSILDFVTKGGPTMLAIVACSLVALAVIVERLVMLRWRNVISPGLLAGLSAVAGDREKALAFCKLDGSPAASLLSAAIRRRGESRDAIEKSVEEAGRRETVRLRHRMRVLGALPQVSTMLGLLGTIFGMIKTFQAVAASGQALGKTEMLAKGIFEAWTNTAAGLIVAIPVLIAYHALLGRIDMLVVELDRVAVDFVEEEDGRSKAARNPIVEPRANDAPLAQGQPALA